MAENFGFPNDLLKATADEKIDYFKKYTVSHHYLKQAYNELTNIIKNPVNNSIILVFGPCGVGKTTLFWRTVKHFIELSEKELVKDPGRIPITGLEAAAPDNGNFDWKDHYIRSLNALDEPLIDKKVNFEKKSKVNYHHAARAHRNSLESALKYRRPYAFMIDEAQHFSQMTSGRKLRNQMDIVKSLASNSGVPHVLFGTYELLPFRNLSGQLSRRGIDIHIPRYRFEVEGDMDQFIYVLGAFQKHIPMENEPKLVDNYEFFYQRSMGCIGILKDWLVRSFSDVLKKRKKTLGMDIFRRNALSEDQCIQIAREAREGELSLEQNREKQNDLLRLLGMDIQDETKSEAKKPKQSIKVGEQKPNRHDVGDMRNAQ